VLEFAAALTAYVRFYPSSGAAGSGIEERHRVHHPPGG